MSKKSIAILIVVLGLVGVLGATAAKFLKDNRSELEVIMSSDSGTETDGGSDGE